VFQGSAAVFLRELGIKIAREYARPLYEVYLTREFVIDRENPLSMFLKKMVTTFVPQVEVPQIADRVNVGLLIELLESRELLGEKYRVLGKDVVADVFAPTRALLLLCPFLLEVYLALSDDHHEELVNGLLGDLAFEALYFSHDQGGISNSPYCREIDLRQKKVLELLREGGFSSLGFELRNSLKPHILEHGGYALPASRIYEEIVVSRPLHLGRFVELLATSTFVQHLPEVMGFFKSMQQTANAVTRPVANAYLQTEVEAFRW
jgi:hypothetical protein